MLNVVMLTVFIIYWYAEIYYHFFVITYVDLGTYLNLLVAWNKTRIFYTTHQHYNYLQCIYKSN